MQTGQLNNDFQTCVSHLMNHGMKAKPRGQETRELLNYNLTIRDPRNRIITYPSRKINTAYLLGELVWYLNGENTLYGIEFFSSFWKNITNTVGKEGYPVGTVNSNYGNRLFGKSTVPGIPNQNTEGMVWEKSQWENTKAILVSDPDSRQAIMNIHMPSDRHNGNKDVACTLSLQFFIREDALHMIVNMRSNDVILGFGNDVFQFSMLQEILLLQLRKTYPDLQLGHYFHNAGSMHVYERHFEMATSILKESTNDIPMIEMDEFTEDTMKGLNAVTEMYMEMKAAKLDPMPETFEHVAGYELLSPYWKVVVDSLYLRNEAALHVMFGQDGDHDE